MPEERAPLDPFDEEVLGAVADDRGVSVDRLRELIVRHQERTREFPGVEELVYEWRTRLRYDPLIVRTDEAYFLAVRETVWEEYGDQMGLDREAVSLLRAVHDRQVREVVAGTDETDAFEARVPMLLTRP